VEPHPPIEQENEGAPSSRREKGGSVLWGWVFLSGFLHIVMIGALFFFPQASSRGAVSYPVYTVDLVGGEKIGGGGLDVGIKPAPASKKKPKEVKKKSSSRVSKKKKVKKITKNKRRSQVALAKKQKKKVRKRTEKKATKIATRTKKSTPLKESKKRVKREERTREGLPSEVRNRLIQAALERVKQRAEKRTEDRKSESKKAGIGPGKGQGAAVSEQNGRGGGILKGLEFLIYRTRMLYKIKERWTWVGKNSDLEVTVRFGIQENGEVVKLRIVEASGDPSYDESVIRAVRKASPLPPTPVVYRKDFMDVELTFRPRDLSG